MGGSRATAEIRVPPLDIMAFFQTSEGAWAQTEHKDVE